MRVTPLPSTAVDHTSPGARIFGVLSTYPPTPCGLATFSAALARGLTSVGAETRVVRVMDTASSALGEGVVGTLVNGTPNAAAGGAALLNECDVAIVQHEYGLYGGADGAEVLDVLAGLDIPSIVVAHTILRDPTPHQRSVLVDAAEMAGHVVVMSEAARVRLLARFDVDPAKVTTIPHGATIPTSRRRVDPRLRPTLLTWGLIGPGKGIERAIDAMRTLHDRQVPADYLVAGRTHPKVLAAEGEAYRDSLIDRARRHGIASSVSFDATYRDVPSLTGLIQSAAAIVLPYDSSDQVTSGVLVDAIAAGRPVIATAFPHAVELLATGAGIVVDHDDPDALARALHRVLTEPGLAGRMADEAARIAPSLGWPVVAEAYLAIAAHLVSERPALV